MWYDDKLFLGCWFADSDRHGIRAEVVAPSSTSHVAALFCFLGILVVSLKLQQVSWFLLFC